MANYYGNRGNGSSLRHYRTKGSRNGYSKDPNYKPIGQRASGRIVNGRYVYENPNDWQQTANKTAAAYRAINAYSKGRTRDVDFGSEKNVSEGDARVLGSRFDKAVNKRAAVKAAIRNGEANNWQQVANKTAGMYTMANRIESGLSNRGRFGSLKNVSEGDQDAINSRNDRIVAKRLSQKVAKNNWQQKADRERAGTEAANRISPLNKYASKAVYMPRRVGGDAYVTNSPFSIDTERRPIGPTTNINSVHNAQTEAARVRSKGSTGLNMNSVHNAQTERARHEALVSTAKGIEGGMIKNRDQVVKGIAKLAQDKLRTANPYGEQKNVGGAMRNDPRYSSNSVIGTRAGNMNKQELAAVGSAMKGAYNKIAHPIDQQVNKLKGTAAKATREVKKTASNVVNKGKAAVDSILKKFKKKK